MINELVVSNFRSLADDTHVRLGPLTLLVGPNGAGKSSVLDALAFVADVMHMGLPGAITTRNGITAVRRWTGGHPPNVAIRLNLSLDEGSAVYEFELAGAKSEAYAVKSEHCSVLAGGQCHTLRRERNTFVEAPPDLRPAVDGLNLALPLVGGDARFRPVAEALKNLAVYTIFPDTLRAPQTYSPRKPMDRHGDNWASILKDQPADTWKPDLLTALQKLTGDIEDIRVSSAASFLVVEFKHHAEVSGRQAKWLGSGQQSDGTLRFAGLTTALLQEPPVAVVGLEEPELTVHPGALPLLVDFIRQATRRSQVIVTTHSPELLDLVDPDNVRVVARRGDVSTVRPLATDQVRAVRARLMRLGELMTTEGLQQELP